MSPMSRPHRLSRDDGWPAEDAASQGARRPAGPARSDRPHDAASQHGIGMIDLLVVNLYPFEATVAKGADYDDLRREHRHRRPRHDPRGGQEPCGRHRHRRSRGLRGLARRNGKRRHDHARLPPADGRQGLCAHRRLRHRHRDLVRDACRATRTPTWRTFGGHLRQELRYGENPHQWAAFYANGDTAPRRRDGDAAPGQGTVLQQPQRHRRSLRTASPNSIAAKGAGRRHHQARQSLRRRDRRDVARRLSRGLALRSRQRVRRHRRAQPADRRGGGRGDHQDLHRSRHRAGRHAPRPRRFSPPRKTCAC